MPNDREFRLPKTLIAVLAVNAGVALAAYGSCQAPTGPSPVSSQVAPGPTGPLVVTAPVFVSTSEPSPEIEPAREEVATAPGPSQIGRDPFSGAPQSPDGGTRDPCPACGMG